MNVNTTTSSHRDSGLQGFLHTGFCRAVARLLMVVLLVTGMPVDYSRPAWAAPAGAPSTAVAEALTVGNYTLVSTTRFNRTLFDFTYTATLTNAGGESFQNVTATLTSRATTTQVIDGKLTFGKVGPGAVLRSQNTFTIRQDRTVPFNPADLVWTVSYNHAPTAEAGPDRSVSLHTSTQLDGSGSSDVDGDALTYHWTLTPPPGSNAVLSDSSAVKPTFTVDVRGNYVAQLVVRDGVTDSPADTVTLSTVNSKPVANAGPDQTVRVGTVVTLDGSGSSDVDGDKLSYAWTLTSTPLESKATLQKADQVNPQFTVDKPGEYHVQLLVSDGQAESEADIVIVSTENSPPVARAGPDQTVRVNDPVNLDGSGSSDADGDPLSYAWALLSKPAGSSAALVDPTTVNPHFVVDKSGTYVAQLIVRDGKADSAPATVTISTENSKPVANAGPDQTVITGSTVVLDGSGSHDADDDPLTYQWTLTTVPTGSHATLVHADTVNPTFTADRPGTYVAQLIVRDGKADSAPDTVTISTENSKPVANAGPDQTAFVNEPVSLTGAGSTDPDGDPLTFQWSLLSTPPHSTAALSGVTAPNPSFIPDLIGRYVAQLIVNDGKLNSDPATVRVDAVRRNQAPVITSAPITTATVGQSYVYDVDATDPDAGDTLTFSLTIAPTDMAIEAATGLIGWTPTEAQVGSQPVTVQVQDSGGLSAIQSFSITVARGNRPPAASNDAYNLTQDETLSIAAPGVLANDSDPDGDSLTAMPVDNPTHGALTLNPDGAFVYTPAAGFIGEDTFTYKANDGRLDSTVATVTIKVHEANKPPVITSTPNTAQWMQLTPTGTPPDQRWLPGASIDPVNDRLIVFGGDGSAIFNDVWVLTSATGINGTPAWIKLAPTGVPPKARSYPSAVYDVTANRLIVHGGCDGHCGNILSDTWVLTNANGLGGTPEWVRLPVDAPLAGHAAAYDPVSNRMIVFGGRPAAYTDTNTVRILKDANGIGTPDWVTLAPVGVAPPPRGEVAAAAYDSLSNRLIVFGGRLTQALNAGSLNDVWVLTNANGLSGTPEWIRLEPAGAPPEPRGGHSMSYDSNSGRLIVTEGNSGNLDFTFHRNVWVLEHANGIGGTPEWKRLDASTTFGRSFFTPT